MRNWLEALGSDDVPLSFLMAGCVRGHYEGPEYCEACGQDLPRDWVCDEWDEGRRAVHQKQMEQYWGAYRFTISFPNTTDGVKMPPDGQNGP